MALAVRHDFSGELWIYGKILDAEVYLFVPSAVHVLI